MNFRDIWRRRARVLAGSGPAPVVTSVTFVPATGITTTSLVVFSETHTGAVTFRRWVFKIDGVIVGDYTLSDPSIAFQFLSPGSASVELTLTGPDGVSPTFTQSVGTVTSGAGSTYVLSGYVVDGYVV